MNDKEQMISDLNKVIATIETTKLDAIKIGNSRRMIICEDKINDIKEVRNEIIMGNVDEDIIRKAKSILEEYGINREKEKIKKDNRIANIGGWVGFVIALVANVTYIYIRSLKITDNSCVQIIYDTEFLVYLNVYSVLFGYVIGTYCAKRILKRNEQKSEKNDNTFIKK